MNHHLRSLADTLFNAVYPPVCLLCDAALASVSGRLMLCDACRHGLIHDPFPACPRCTSTVGPGVDVAEGCERCRKTSFAFSSALRLGSYDHTLREAILKLKHSQGESLAETLGLLWAGHHREKFQALAPQLILPVPLHYVRRWQRGYNQAATLARMIAAELQVPWQPHWLRRIRNTPLQASRSAEARRENVRGAFRLSRFARVSGLRVLIVDDVLTTGATAHETARVLLAGGASRIDVAVLAHR